MQLHTFLHRHDDELECTTLGKLIFEFIFLIFCWIFNYFSNTFFKLIISDEYNKFCKNDVTYYKFNQILTFSFFSIQLYDLFNKCGLGLSLGSLNVVAWVLY